MKIKKGDNVAIKIGKDSGKTGKIASVDPSANKVIVLGLNQVKKAVKPKKQGDKGQIVSISLPIPAANVMLVCPACGKETRVGYKVEGNDKKRYCKKCSSVI